MENTKIDIVIPVYRPGEEFLDVLWLLKKQTQPISRIILINTEKEFFDESVYVNADNIEVVHVTKEEFDHAATRHMGIEMSYADYVIFMTMDAVPKDEHLVEKLLAGIQANPKTAVAYARQLPKKNCRMIEQITRRFNYPKKSRFKTAGDLDELGIKTYFCSDVCAMYDRRIYLELGGFVDSAIFNEDMFYAAKAIQNGYGIMYCADACVRHSHNYSCMQQYRRNFDMGVSQAEHPEIFDGISSENEGMRLVKTTVKELIKAGHWYDIPYLFISSAFKLFGYRKGKKYKSLSQKAILKRTSNRYYWKF